jgi:coenzyme F420-reducing hydrogenase gamma subunit
MTKIGFIQLNSCGGCLFAVLGSIVFPDLLKSAEIRLFRLISDLEGEEHLDVAFVEGGVAQEAEAALLRKLWTDGTKIVALGSCAALGGVVSSSTNMHVSPISEFVDPYAVLPGCPPPRRLLGNLLLAAINATGFKLPDKNVCAECPFAQDQTFSTEVFALQPTSSPKSCFLREGILCLGPITRAGCEARCIKGSVPCDGCSGAIGRDLPSAIANLFSVLKATPAIRDYAAIAFRYQKPELK